MHAPLRRRTRWSGPTGRSAAPTRRRCSTRSRLSGGRGKHPRRRLRDFRGILQADGYAGFNGPYEGSGVVEAACWSPSRREFHDVLLATGSPIAREVIERIGVLYAIETEIYGKAPEARWTPAGLAPRC